MALGQVLQGCLYIARLARRDGTAPAHFRQIRGRNGVDFIGDGHCRERRAMRCNWRQKPFHIFGIEHAADDMGLAFGQSGKSCSDGASGGGVMSAIEPNLMARKAVDQRALAQPLHACGPIGLRHSGDASLFALSEIPQGGDRSAGILNLMRTGQARQGQIQQAGFILIDQAPHFSADMPMLPVYLQICTNFCRLAFDHLERLFWLRAHNSRDPAL